MASAKRAPESRPLRAPPPRSLAVKNTAFSKVASALALFGFSDSLRLSKWARIISSSSTSDYQRVDKVSEEVAQ